jgi:hypothetical protein
MSLVSAPTQRAATTAVIDHVLSRVKGLGISVAADSSQVPIVKRLVPAHVVENPLTLPFYPLSGHPASRYEKGQ